MFSVWWKKGNIVPIHKKGDKNRCCKTTVQCRCYLYEGKILERLIFNEIFEYFTEIKLISSRQSGFKPGYSRINQLLSITHEIDNSFDEGLEVRIYSSIS